MLFGSSLRRTIATPGTAGRRFLNCVLSRLARFQGAFLTPYFDPIKKESICKSLREAYLSQFHRALHNLRHKHHIEIEQAPRSVHGFKGYRLKQAQTALAV